MKFLIALLLTMNFSFAVEIDKQTLAEEQLGRLNTLYKGLDSFCEAPAKAFHADLVIACKAQKTRIKDEFASRLEFIIQKRLIDGEAKVKADAEEADSLLKARQEADKFKVAYLQNDTSVEVWAKVNAYLESLKGSGSGGQ